MDPQWLPARRYCLPFASPIRGARDAHLVAAGTLVGYGTPTAQGWMTAPDLPGRPQWRAPIDAFARDVAQDAYRAAGAGVSWAAQLAGRFGTTARPWVPVSLTTDWLQVVSGNARQVLASSSALAIKIKVDARLTPDALAQGLHLLAAPPGTQVRLDANGAWAALRPDQLHDLLQACADLGVHSVEDPVPLSQWPGQSPVPLAADLVDSDWITWRARVLSGEVALAVLKPSLLGSLEAFGQLTAELAQRQIPVALSSLFDAPTGLARLCELAAAMPGDLQASGIVTHLALEPRWRPPLLEPQAGRVQVSSGARQWAAPVQQDLCAQAAADKPDARALTWHDTAPQHWTWTQLDDAADRLAAWLQRRGLGSGDRVAVWADNCPEVAVLLFASLRLGLVLAPLHPRWTPAEAGALLTRLQPRLVLVDALRLGALANAVALPTIATLPPDRPSLTYLHADAAAVIVATSGTTGTPQLVVHNGQSLDAAAHAHWVRFAPRDGERWLACLPLCHVSGLGVLLRCAAARAEVLAVASGDAAQLSAALAAFPCTTASLVPLQLIRLLDSSVPPGALAVVLVGGASVEPALLQRARDAGWPAVPTWGMTETFAQAATGLVTQPPLSRGGLRRVGMPLPGVWAQVRPDAPGDVMGEIQVATVQAFAGYWGAAPSTQLWFNTGDIGWMDDQGALWVASRRTDRIIVAGENVDPLEVEAVLRSLADVLDVAVVGLDDRGRGQVVAAWLQVAASRPDWPQRVADHTASLAPFKRPRVLWATPREPPRNALGKLQRGEVCRVLMRLRDGLDVD